MHSRGFFQKETSTLIGMPIPPDQLLMILATFPLIHSLKHLFFIPRATSLMFLLFLRLSTPRCPHLVQHPTMHLLSDMIILLLRL
jgi:hypothetical protein